MTFCSHSTILWGGGVKIQKDDKRQTCNIVYFCRLAKGQGQAVSFFPTIKQILIPILVREILMG